MGEDDHLPPRRQLFRLPQLLPGKLLDCPGKSAAQSGNFPGNGFAAHPNFPVFPHSVIRQTTYWLNKYPSKTHKIYTYGLSFLRRYTQIPQVPSATTKRTAKTMRNQAHHGKPQKVFVINLFVIQLKVIGVRLFRFAKLAAWRAPGPI